MIKRQRTNSILFFDLNRFFCYSINYITHAKCIEHMGNGQKNPSIKCILRYGILAPSTHNSQPWLFRIKENSVEIYSNSLIHIKEADPKGRDLYISLGCVIENIVIAARYFGMFKNIAYRIGELPGLVAEIFFIESGAKNLMYQDIFETIVTRVTARGMFTSAEIPPRIFEDLSTLSNEYGEGGLEMRCITQKKEIERIASLTAEGLKIAYRSKSFRKEMSQWVHNSFTRKKDGIPGYSLKIPFIVSFIFPYLVRIFDIGKKLAHLNYISLASAPAIVVLSSSVETKERWLETGRLAERLMLELQSKGFQTSIFVASIEMGELYKEVQKVLGTTAIPNFLCAVGKIGGSFRPTPRYSVEEKLI